MDPRDDWLGQQLAEFLGAVGSYPDEDSAIAAAVERAAEALDAEFGAIIRNGVVLSAVGFARGRVPEEELRDLVARRASVVELPGAGGCPALVVPLGSVSGDALLLARCEGTFTRQEASLLRGMAKALRTPEPSRAAFHHPAVDLRACSCPRGVRRHHRGCR